MSDFINSLFSSPITMHDIISYFIALTILGYLTNITFRRGDELWEGIKGSDGKIQPVEMLVTEYLIIMPAILISSVFLKIEVVDEAWSFLEQITAFLLAGKLGEKWIKNHYESKKS